MPKPKPFQRPTISVGSTSRSWQRVVIERVAEGDVIAGQGLVHDAKQLMFGETAVLVGENSSPVIYLPGEEVFAFTK